MVVRGRCLSFSLLSWSLASSCKAYLLPQVYLIFFNVDLCFIYKSQLFWIMMCLQGYTGNMEGKMEKYKRQKMSYSNKFFFCKQQPFLSLFYVCIYMYSFKNILFH